MKIQWLELHMYVDGVYVNNYIEKSRDKYFAYFNGRIIGSSPRIKEVKDMILIAGGYVLYT